MEQLRIVESTYLNDLANELANSIDLYRQAEPRPLDPNRMIPSPITPSEVPPELVCSSDGSTAEEAENAIKLHRWLLGLTPVQASDPRLWATLTHTHFWSYVGRRWPGLKLNPDKPVDYVREHWLVLGGGLASLRRNAISRLWWAGRLTWRPWDSDGDLECFRVEDSSKYTKILMSNQQIPFDLLERNYGSSIRIRICVLDALDRCSKSGASMTDLSREAAKQLNCVARTRNLDSMPVPDLRDLCFQLVSRQADSLIAASATS